MKTILRFFFYLLYHQFAFTYDLVAAIVSFNRWQDWVMSVVPFIEGQRILEIGHGPGHLQQRLLNQNLFSAGIDESAQMGHLAKRNWRRQASPKNSSSNTAYMQINLTRGIAQHLPFSNDSFDTVVATFPAPFIFEVTTLMEIERVLANGGRFVILPGAVITGRGGIDRALALLFRVTGEAPPDLSQTLQERSRQPFSKTSFQVEVHEVEVRSSLAFIMVATKTRMTEASQDVAKTG